MKNPMERQLNLMEIYLHKNRAEQSLQHLLKSLQELTTELRRHGDHKAILSMQDAGSMIDSLQDMIEDIADKYKPF